MVVYRQQFGVAVGAARLGVTTAWPVVAVGWATG